MKQFLKMTLVGGVLFLLPVALVAAVLNHALQLAMVGVKPISHGLGLDKLGTFAGVGATVTLAAALLIVLSFVAGLIALTSVGRRLSRWLETSFLGDNPQYKAAKSVVGSLVRVDDKGGLAPVLVESDGAWRLGYLVEELEGDWRVVFLPQAPNPAAGSIIFVPAGRLRPLDLVMADANAIVQHIGVGSAQALKGVDLGQGVERDVRRRAAGWRS